MKLRETVVGGITGLAAGLLVGATVMSTAAAPTPPTLQQALDANAIVQQYLESQNAPSPTPTPTPTPTPSTPTPTPTPTTPSPTPTTPTPTPTVTVPGSLPYAPPAGYLNYTKVTIPAGGGTLSLSSGKDYLIVAPNVVTGPVTITGGRNRVLIGAVFAGRTSVPSGSYDSTNRGIRLSDGDDAGLDFLEGLWFKPGTYLSDAIQVAYRSNNNRDLTVQNIRVDAFTYGSKAGVHADSLQFWGGPRTFKAYNWTATKVGYQGWYLDVADGRSLPTGTNPGWVYENVNMVGAPASSYAYTNREPGQAKAVAKNFYVADFKYSGINDSYGNAPAGVVVGTHSDFAPASLWVNNAYVSPGYK